MILVAGLRHWAVKLTSHRQGEMQDGLPLRGCRFPDTTKPDLSFYF